MDANVVAAVAAAAAAAAAILVELVGTYTHESTFH